MTVLGFLAFLAFLTIYPGLRHFFWEVGVKSGGQKMWTKLWGTRKWLHWDQKCVAKSWGVTEE